MSNVSEISSLLISLDDIFGKEGHNDTNNNYPMAFALRKMRILKPFNF